MKKLLAILSAFGLTATATTAVVACKKPDNTDNRTVKISIEKLALGSQGILRVEVNNPENDLTAESANLIKTAINVNAIKKMKEINELKDINILDSDFTVVGGDNIVAGTAKTAITSTEYKIKATDASKVITGTSQTFKVELVQTDNPIDPEAGKLDLGNKKIETELLFYYDKNKPNTTPANTLFNEVVSLNKPNILKLIQDAYEGQDTSYITAENLQKGQVYTLVTADGNAAATNEHFTKDGQTLYAEYVGINQLKGKVYIKVTVVEKTMFKTNQKLRTIFVNNLETVVSSTFVTGNVQATTDAILAKVNAHLEDIVNTLLRDKARYIDGSERNLIADNILAVSVMKDDITALGTEHIREDEDVQVTITAKPGTPLEGSIKLVVKLKNTQTI